MTTIDSLHFRVSEHKEIVLKFKNYDPNSKEEDACCKLLNFYFSCMYTNASINATNEYEIIKYIFKNHPVTRNIFWMMYINYVKLYKCNHDVARATQQLILDVLNMRPKSHVDELIDGEHHCTQAKQSYKDFCNDILRREYQTPVEADPISKDISYYSELEKRYPYERPAYDSNNSIDSDDESDENTCVWASA
jgi:hypothetical protein